LCRTPRIRRRRQSEKGASSSLGCFPPPQ
jgi:hypothetical protein